MVATGKEEYTEDVHNTIFKIICENSVDPFSFLTIASVCIGIFRTKFLPVFWQILPEDEAILHPNFKHK